MYSRCTAVDYNMGEGAARYVGRGGSILAGEKNFYSWLGNSWSFRPVASLKNSSGVKIAISISCQHITFAFQLSIFSDTESNSGTG